PTLVIKIQNLTNFKSELKNNSFLAKIKGLSTYQHLFEKLDNLGHVSTNATCLLAPYEVGKDNYDFVMVVPNNPDIFNLEKVTDKTIETLTYQNTTITKYTLGTNEIYSLPQEKKMVLASSLLLMENMIRTKDANPINPTLRKLYEATSPSKSATFFLNLDKNPSLLSLKEGNNNNPLSEWTSLDFSAN